jgi:ABC-2 type transport system ATP-binding protein
MNIFEASGLGKRYRSTWALRECTLAIPAGHVTALVGPNGAGKTTLLNLAVGLTAPSAGEVTVLGGRLPGSPGALDGIAFVAQDTPLYKTLSAADLLHLPRNLTRFDQAYAEARLAEFGIPLKRKAGKLSGGQQAQVALTLGLARRPQLLVMEDAAAAAAAAVPGTRNWRGAGDGAEHFRPRVLVPGRRHPPRAAHRPSPPRPPGRQPLQAHGARRASAAA